ncbi:MAG: DUF503 domain-containing protein [Candidatus Dormibacteraceae bacterium]
MLVGTAKILLHLPGSESLKDKRRVIAGLLKLVRSRFEVAAAEVGEGDRWQRAELGVCCVSNDRRHADEVLAKVLGFIEDRAGDAVVTAVETEILTV